jgi:hypothetical protein
VIGLLATSWLGCSSAAPPAASPSETDSAIPVQRLPRMTVTGYSTEELVAELRKARSYLMEGRYQDAARSFDRLMRLAADPELKALAAFNAGIAHEELGQRELALQRYQRVTDDHAVLDVARGAQLRLTRLLGYLERWPELAAAASQLLDRKDLAPLDRIEGLGALGLAHAEQGDIDAATRALAKAWALIEERGIGRSSAPPVQLAQVSFAEGEVRRLKSERIKLTPVPPNFAEVLEARCQGLLDAQGAFTEAMRSRDAHWSAMSGFRVGQLYQQLHREAMEIPAPKSASLEQQRLFEAAMRLRYRILLEKGLKMMNGTVELGERTGEDSEWVARAKLAKQSLEQALADEKAALAKTPYTEEELRAALEKLKAKSQSAAATP